MFTLVSYLYFSLMEGLRTKNFFIVSFFQSKLCGYNKDDCLELRCLVQTMNNILNKFSKLYSSKEDVLGVQCFDLTQAHLVPRLSSHFFQRDVDDLKEPQTGGVLRMTASIISRGV